MGSLGGSVIAPILGLPLKRTRRLLHGLVRLPCLDATILPANTTSPDARQLSREAHSIADADRAGSHHCRVYTGVVLVETRNGLHDARIFLARLGV